MPQFVGLTKKVVAFLFPITSYEKIPLTNWPTQYLATPFLGQVIITSAPLTVKWDPDTHV